jgi:hypothetical protein
VLTAGAVGDAFGHPVHVDRHPDTGAPRFTPRVF